MVKMKKFTQTDLQKLIKDLDSTCPQLLSLQINGFCIWPTVKVVLWRYLTKELVEDESKSASNSLITKSKFVRLKAYLSMIGMTFIVLLKALLPNLKTLMKSHNQPLDLLIIHPNRVNSSFEGEHFDQFFGFFSGLDSFIVGSIHPPNHQQTVWEQRAEISIDVQFLNSLVVATAIKDKLIGKHQKQTSRVVSLIHNILQQKTGVETSLPKPLIHAAIAHFLATMEIYTLVLKRLKPAKLFVIDFDSKLGEIAAAKSLGIPTYDVQHGTFWSHDLDHSWLGESAKFLSQLTFPDYLLVRGKLWANIAKELDFWKQEQIMELGCACMSRYLPKRKRPVDVDLSKKRLNVLFISGDIHVSQTQKFIFDLLAEAEQSLHLTIKLHPREPEQSHPLQELVASFSGLVTLKNQFEDIYQLILESDLVIGSNSTALIEAAVLGTPTFSLGVGSTPEGLAAAHGNNPTLKCVLGFASTPSSLMNQIFSLKQNPSKTLDWMAKVEKSIPTMYTPNFSKNLTKIVANDES